MNKTNWTACPKAAALNDMLDHREEISRKQELFLTKWKQTLICFSLNVPGPYKQTPMWTEVFSIGLKEILSRLASLSVPLTEKEICFSHCGTVGFFVLPLSPRAVKRELLALEEEHPLGRFFDIDVLSPQGEKYSRSDFRLAPRKCLICQRAAYDCGRSRRHSAAELTEASQKLILSYLHGKCLETLPACMLKAMLYEVMTTPKPGLVDRLNNGAHKDMNAELFTDSAFALLPYFRDCAEAGLSFSGASLPRLFTGLRARGKAAEQEMYAATGGVNTHKGLIFSGGILCAVTAYAYAQHGDTCDSLLQSLCREMLTPALTEEIAAIRHTPCSDTHGESLFSQDTDYGGGIRGEALAGFPALFQIAEPAFLNSWKKNHSLYAAGRCSLLHIMAKAEDSNAIYRSSPARWRALQADMQDHLDQNDASALSRYLSDLDDIFIRENISPGGSADVLALTYFLHFWRFGNTQ